MCVCVALYPGLLPPPDVSYPDPTHKRERLSSDFWGFRVEKLDYQSDFEEPTHDIHMAYTSLVMHSSLIIAWLMLRPFSGDGDGAERARSPA